MFSLFLFILINFVCIFAVENRTVRTNMTNTSLIKIEFNRIGYDPFIDFLKGICIVLIILNHCIPSDLRTQLLFPVWGSPAVPIFFMIQVFHFYKKGIDATRLDFYKMWNRVVRPFLIVEVIIWAILFCMEYSNNTIPSLKDTLYILTGGPGTYYPWIYIQFALLLPLTRPFVRIKSVYAMIVFVLFSQFAEMICASFSMPEWIYRLSFFRYIFLVYLGFLLATQGLTLNRTTLMLSIISVVSVFLFSYSSIDFSPYFYHVKAWSTCHWICYVYIAFFVIICLKVIYSYIGNHAFSNFIRQIGKYSYEIYLFQLLYFTCFSEFIINQLSLNDKTLIIIIISTLLCIIPVLLYKQLIWRLKSKEKITK